MSDNKPIGVPQMLRIAAKYAGKDNNAVPKEMMRACVSWYQERNKPLPKEARGALRD